MNDELGKYATISSKFGLIVENSDKYREPLIISEVLEGIHPKYTAETISMDDNVMTIRLPLKEKLAYNS